MTDPEVTVVIPTRNRVDWLAEAVTSIVEQTRDCWELIVIDDASTDGTADWLASLDDPRVHSHVLVEHGERSVARNTGLDAARGEFILFLDDDDRLKPKALATLVSALRRAPVAVAAAGAKEAFDDQGNRKRWLHPRRRHVRNVTDEVLFGWVGTPGECLWRTEVLRRAGRWRSGVHPIEDQELWLRVSTLGPVAVIPEVVLEYRRHGGQARPPETPALEWRVRDEFVETLPPPDRASRRHAIVARARFARALTAEDAAPRRVLPLVLAACAAKPSLVLSPLTGATIRRLLARSLVEFILGRAGRRGLLSLLWRIRGRRRTAIRLDQWREEQS